MREIPMDFDDIQGTIVEAFAALQRGLELFLSMGEGNMKSLGNQRPGQYVSNKLGHLVPEFFVMMDCSEWDPFYTSKNLPIVRQMFGDWAERTLTLASEASNVGDEASTD